MTDKIIAIFFKYVWPRLTKWFAGLLDRFKENKELKGKQEARMNQAEKVEALRQQIIKIQKGEVQVSNEKKNELIEQLREESRKLSYPSAATD
jgi:ABC-type phosphate transport system auxiliary subunit